MSRREHFFSVCGLLVAFYGRLSLLLTDNETVLTAGGAVEQVDISKRLQGKEMSFGMPLINLKAVLTVFLTKVGVSISVSVGPNPS